MSSWIYCYTSTAVSLATLALLSTAGCGSPTSTSSSLRGAAGAGGRSALETNSGGNSGAVTSNQWIQATANAAFSPRAGHAVLNFNSQLWVIGGVENGTTLLNDVWSSADGITWSQVTQSAAFSARGNHCSVVFNNQMWVIGGKDTNGPLNDSWSSSDGSTWTQATSNAGFAKRYSHTGIVKDGKMWILGGNSVTVTYSSTVSLSDVWNSADGTTWTEAATASFTARGNHASAVHDNNMWVVGGHDYAPATPACCSDSWYSADGVLWTRAVTNASFGARVGHTLDEYSGEMWVIAGSDPTNGGAYGDVWYSTDGANWLQSTAMVGFAPRYRHASVVYNNEMWVIGGTNGSTWWNDVWYYDGS